jgi:hypothetical protein
VKNENSFEAHILLVDFRATKLFIIKSESGAIQPNAFYQIPIVL